jgi:hypothetical protein
MVSTGLLVLRLDRHEEAETFLGGGRQAGRSRARQEAMIVP